MDSDEVFFNATQNIPDYEIDLLLLFKVRASEFVENYRDLSLDKIQQYSFENPLNGPLTAKGLQVDRHRLKGLLVDYRALHATNERIKFLETINRIKRYFSQTEVRTVLESLRESWLDNNHITAMKRWDFDRFIEVVFNASHFHTSIDLQSDFKRLKADFTDEAINTIIFAGVQYRFLVARNVLYFLGPFNAQSHQIRIPNVFLRRRNLLPPQE